MKRLLTALTAIVIGAEDDQVVPAYLQRELAAAIPGAGLAMLASGGHFFPISRREEFTEILKTWLAAMVA